MLEIVSPVAARVIEKCGGVDRVAEICGRSRSWVHKWKYPKSRGGLNGFVPNEDAEKLLAAASRGEVNLQPSDFFVNSGQSGDQTQPAAAE